MKQPRPEETSPPAPYDISEDGDVVEIRVPARGEEQSGFLASLENCKAGNCGCPTDQYDRLETIDVEIFDGDVRVRLRPLPGQLLDVPEIEKCLDYSIVQAQPE